MVKINVEITFSKIMAILILGAGLSASIVLKDSAPLLLAIPIAGGVIVNKQVNDRFKEKYNKNPEVPEGFQNKDLYA